MRDLAHVQLGAAPHQRVEGVRLKARQRVGLALEPEEEIRIADQRDLHGLRHAAALFALGQHVEERRVVDHREWRREGAEQVLEAEGIDGVLHADAGVVLGQHRGRAADMAHAAMEDRRREADRVEHGAAADRDRERLPVDLPRGQVPQHVLDIVVLVLHRLAARHHDDVAGERHRRGVRGGVARDARQQVRRRERHALVDEHREAVTLVGLDRRQRAAAGTDSPDRTGRA